MRFFTFLSIAFMLTNGVTVANDSTAVFKYSYHIHVIDSMKRALSAQPPERRKMELFREIAYMFHVFNHDSTVHYAHKALTIAKKLNDPEVLIGTNSTLGLTHCFAGNYDSAFLYFNRMKEWAAERNDKNDETNALAMLAFTYAKQGKYHTSIEYYLKVLKILENDPALTHRYVGALANLSEINRRLGNTEIALVYLQQAEEKCHLLESGHYRWHMPHICNEYAFNYLKMSEPGKALHYALKADSINWGAQVNACYTDGLLATIYLQLNDYDQALRYVQKSYAWADELQDKNLYAYAGKIMSDVYMAQQHYAEAESAALKVWMADSTYIDESRDVVENIVLANIYMQKTERAAYYLKKYAELNAQYAEKSFQTTVSDMAVKYETEKKETRIATLEKERLLYVFLGVSGVSIAAFLCVVLWQIRRNVQKEKQLIATRSILDGEMKERARLAQDLHDRLSGNLSAVKIELGKHAGTLHNVRDQLDKCIRDIRDAAHDLMPASLHYGMKVALEDFAAQFPNVRFHFFGKEKRIGERLEFVIYCCAGELVNNAVRHSGAKSVNLQLVQDEKHVTLTVSDDGCGFDEKNVVKGFGLGSIRNRVASCNGKMDILTVPGKGTETTIEFEVQ